MFYVYILKLNNGQLYTGYTSDLKRRIAEHKAGKSEFTSQRLPVELIHYEAYKLETDARRRERYLKTRLPKVMNHLFASRKNLKIEIFGPYPRG